MENYDAIFNLKTMDKKWNEEPFEHTSKHIEEENINRKQQCKVKNNLFKITGTK